MTVATLLTVDKYNVSCLRQILNNQKNVPQCQQNLLFCDTVQTVIGDLAQIHVHLIMLNYTLVVNDIKIMSFPKGNIVLFIKPRKEI